jgi:hypothetical protein
MAAKPFEIVVEPKKPLTFRQTATYYGLSKAEADKIRRAVARLVAARAQAEAKPRRRLAGRKK